MVKVAECCCGCTLRTGSLILLWLLLVYSCFDILIYSIILSNLEVLNYVPTTFEILRNSLYLIIEVIGATVSILGIYGIEKDEGKYLSGGYYFLCFNVVTGLIAVVVIIVSPSLYDTLFAFRTHTPNWTEDSQTEQMVFPLVMAFLFLTALTCYFAVVLKSCRDAMLANNKDGRFAKTPDLFVVDYRNAV